MDKQTANHYYLLPDGRTADNMKQACEMMGMGAQGFRALIRKGVVKKITSETERYERNSTTSPLR
jgi:hypothetical protein